MGGRIFDLAAMIAAGVMLADLVRNSQGTSVLIDGIQNLWGQSINGMLGQAG